MNEQKVIDQRTLDLINGRIDAELSDAEQHELAGILATSEEAREANEEVESLARLMDGLPELEPPAYLQDSIERQIRLPVQDDAAGGKQGLFGTWLSANWLRTGFALAAGVVLTIGVYEMGSGPMSEKDANNLVGTVIKSQQPGQGSLLDRILIENAALDGIVELRKSADLFSLDVQLNSDLPTELVVKIDGQTLKFEGISSRQDGGETVSMANGSVIVASTGEQSYTLSLRSGTDPLEGQAAPLALEVFVNKELVHKAELSFARQ